MIQTGWVTAHLDDLASDFSAIHRIDMYRLSGPAFFRAAFRLPAYEGVMRSVVMEAVAEGNGGQVSQPQAQGRQQVNPGTRASLEADPAFAGIISFG